MGVPYREVGCDRIWLGSKECASQGWDDGVAALLCCNSSLKPLGRPSNREPDGDEGVWGSIPTSGPGWSGEILVYVQSLRRLPPLLPFYLILRASKFETRGGDDALSKKTQILWDTALAEVEES